MATADLELISLNDMVEELTKRFDTVVIAFKGQRNSKQHNEDIIIVGDYHDAIALGYRAMVMASNHLDTTKTEDKENPE